MVWKGEDLVTIGDLMAKGIDCCETREEAQEFMRLYRQDSPHADVNIGYLSGYYGATEMRRIQDWFGVEHPVFGLRQPTPEEAFEAGRQLGERYADCPPRPRL